MSCGHSNKSKRYQAIILVLVRFVLSMVFKRNFAEILYVIRREKRRVGVTSKPTCHGHFQLFFSGQHSLTQSVEVN